MIAKLFNCIGCLGAILLACFSISSCSEDNAPTVEEPLPVYSYFRGCINDEYVCVEQNTVHDKRIDYLSTLRSGENILSYRWFVIFIDDYHKSFKNAPSLSIQLAPLELGRYNIKGARFYNDTESAISFGRDGKRYVPNSNHPFKVRLNGMIKSSPYSTDPLIQGTMEGVLYNQDNPTDSLVIRDATFCLVTSVFM